MLTQTACQPLYGRISDLVGRKVNQNIEKAAFLFTLSPEPSLFKYGSFRHWFLALRSRSGTAAFVLLAVPLTGI
jgi:hypothetical protein